MSEQSDLVSDMATPDPPRLVINTQSPSSSFSRLLRAFSALISSAAHQSNQNNHNQPKSESNKKYNNYNYSSNNTTPAIYNDIRNCNGFTLNQSVAYNNTKPITQQNHEDIDDEQYQKINLYIRDFIILRSSLTTDDKIKIKESVNDWKKVARQLGLTKIEAKQHFRNYEHERIGEIFYKLIIYWEQSRGNRATVGKLFKALWLSREYDCIEQLAENYGYSSTS